jgi:transglutaminase superfamily protein
MTGTRPLTPLGKVRLAAEIVFTYIRARVLLLRRDVPAVLASPPRREPPVDSDGDPPYTTGLRLGRAVVRTLSVVPADSRCLVRSLVLSHLLVRRGISSKMIIGVNVEDSFKAHAWVEHEGHPLIDAGTDDFARLVEL